MVQGLLYLSRRMNRMRINEQITNRFSGWILIEAALINITRFSLPGSNCRPYWMKDSDAVFLFCRTEDDKGIRILHSPFGEPAAVLACMIQNATALDSEKQVRRPIWDE